jgi:hypothetical protein
MNAFGGALRGKNVLVVEDEYLLAQNIIADQRRCRGAILGTVTTIRAATDLIAGQRVDAALLDVNLQGDGRFMIAPPVSAIIPRSRPDGDGADLW